MSNLPANDDKSCGLTCWSAGLLAVYCGTSNGSVDNRTAGARWRMASPAPVSSSRLATTSCAHHLQTPRMGCVQWMHSPLCVAGDHTDKRQQGCGATLRPTYRYPPPPPHSTHTRPNVLASSSCVTVTPLCATGSQNPLSNCTHPGCSFTYLPRSLVPLRGHEASDDVELISGFVRQNMPEQPSPDASTTNDSHSPAPPPPPPPLPPALAILHVAAAAATATGTRTWHNEVGGYYSNKHSHTTAQRCKFSQSTQQAW